MMKLAYGLCGAAALAVAATMTTMAVSTPAEAQCVNCSRAPITRSNTVYRYRTVRRVRDVTRFRNVNRTRYRRHVTRVVTVTRVQPITRVHLVTRVHHRTMILRQTQRFARTSSLPMRTFRTGRTVHINHGAFYGGTCCR
jgi:hypothetical protein